jgi:hypothetical protein
MVPVSVTTPVPLPVMAAPPPTAPMLTLPPPAEVNVVLMSFPPAASTSEMERPMMAWVNPDITVKFAGTPLLTGASSTAVTLMVSVTAVLPAAPSLVMVVTVRARPEGFSLVLT